MLGVILDVIEVPAAALRRAAPGRLAVAAANRALGAVLRCDPATLVGEPASVLVPEPGLSRWAGAAGLAEPVETRLGDLALPYRAVARALPGGVASGPGLLVVTFLPAGGAPLPHGGGGGGRGGGLAPVDLGVTALEVLDMQAEMVSRWRPDGTILYCNEAFAQQCGRPIDEVIGANLFALTPPHEIEQIRRNIARLSPEAPTSGYDHHIVPAAGDDDERWQEWIDRLLTDEDGRVAGYLSVGRDITGRKLAERGLAESERRLKLALEAGRQGVWELDIASRRIAIDRALEDLFRLPGGGYHLDIDGAEEAYHPDDREQVRRAIGAVVAGETDAYRVEARRRRGDGTYFWVMNFGRVAERDGSGRPLRVVGTTIDIDQRKGIEVSLRDREQRLRLALEAGYLGVWECDLDGERVRYDGLCLARLGWEAGDRERALGAVLDLVHPRDRARVRATFAQFRRGASQARVEFRMQRRDGGYAWIEDHAQVSERGAGGRPTRIVGVSADITARKEGEMRLAHLALHDPLTGLPNRRALAEALERAIARAGRSGLPLAVLALDLDGFKAINDRHGHPAGDATLLEVAGRLRRVIRRSDLVARLGGDEFAVIAGELSGPAPVARLARRIGAALREPVRLPQEVVAEVGVSVGVAFYPGDGGTTEQLLTRADAALYAAKRERAGCRFSADLPVAAPA